MGFCKDNKTHLIRQMLLKTMGKSPDLFCYYAAILEAKELLGQSELNHIDIDKTKISKPNKLIAEG